MVIIISSVISLFFISYHFLPYVLYVHLPSINQLVKSSVWLITKVLLSSFVFIFMCLVNERTEVRLCFHKSCRFCSTPFFFFYFFVWLLLLKSRVETTFDRDELKYWFEVLAFEFFCICFCCWTLLLGRISHALLKGMVLFIHFYWGIQTTDIHTTWVNK